MRTTENSRRALFCRVRAAAVAAWLTAAIPYVAVMANGRPAPDPRPDLKADLEAFQRRLQDAAGKGARACGLLVVGDDPKPVTSCGIEESSNHRPFWLVIQIDGVDTTIWSGLLQNSKGDSYQFDVVADPWSFHWSLSHPTVKKCILSLDRNADYQHAPFNCAPAVAPEQSVPIP